MVRFLILLEIHFLILENHRKLSEEFGVATVP